jgi:hypothetical protein
MLVVSMDTQKYPEFDGILGELSNDSCTFYDDKSCFEYYTITNVSILQFAENQTALQQEKMKLLHNLHCTCS